MESAEEYDGKDRRGEMEGGRTEERVDDEEMGDEWASVGGKRRWGWEDRATETLALYRYELMTIFDIYCVGCFLATE